MKKLFLLMLLLLSSSLAVLATEEKNPEDEVKVMQKAKIRVDDEEVFITISKVNVTHFPEITLFFEAYKGNGEPVETLKKEGLRIYEDGKPKEVIDLQKLESSENQVVDFVFLIDKTATMQHVMDQVKNNIHTFAKGMEDAHIDYKIGLILFSDKIEYVLQPTKDIDKFLEKMNSVVAEFGGDNKENALEALEATAEKIKYRESASRIAMIFTDAGYHQAGENGSGTTNHTTKSIIKLLQNNQIRLFSVTSKFLEEYYTISKNTRGGFYDISKPFTQTAGNFTGQISNVFYLTYRSGQETIPDSIEISLLEPKLNKWVRKQVPISGLGRKLIIENLLFATGSSMLRQSVPELDLVAQFMRKKAEIALIVEGHTDAVGSDHINQILSQKRANAVKNYLVSQGINERRIQTKGYGERKPIASNETEEGKRRNRRTELVIIND
jgi:outer membrane protein OmpA-like peptidoglycan-associated protein